jgi:DNA-binding CsgD family transcriptional regulator
MRSLAERDAAALLEVTAELAALDDPAPFPAHFLGALSKLLGSASASYCELDRARLCLLGERWYDEGVEGGEPPLDDTDDPYWRLRHSHPICSYRERANEWTTTRMITDFTTLRGFRDTEIWNEVYRDIPIVDWIDVGLRPAGAETRMFLFTRTRGAFDERDRLVLELLQPQLQARYDRVRVAADAADALADVDWDDPTHIVLCSRGGAIEFASPESRRLLATYVACENGHVPDALLHGPVLVTAERDGRRLTVRTTRSGDLLVLLLGEEDVRLDRLTTRQRTILQHVASGQTDTQIAVDLGISRATVNKHLEQIYARLGVHTRTAAAAALVR